MAFKAVREGKQKMKIVYVNKLPKKAKKAKKKATKHHKKVVKKHHKKVVKKHHKKVVKKVVHKVHPKVVVKKKTHKKKKLHVSSQGGAHQDRRAEPQGSTQEPGTYAEE